MSRRKNLLTLLKGIATIPALILIIIVMMVTMLPALFLMMPGLVVGMSLLFSSIFVGLVSPSLGARVSRRGNSVMEFLVSAFFEKWVERTVGRFIDVIEPFTII